MKLVTYLSPADGPVPRLGVLLADQHSDPAAGMVLDVRRAFERVQPNAVPVPTTMQALLEAGPRLLEPVRAVLAALAVDDAATPTAAQQGVWGAAAWPLRAVQLLAPLPRP